MAKMHDVAIIGAGVFGSWVALEMEQRGVSAVLIDAYGPANSRASSGGESRIIRAGYGADEVYSRWAHESLAAWQKFFRETAQPLFYPTGVLWLGRLDEPRAQTTLETLGRLGIRHERLSHDRIRLRWPQFRLEPGEEAIFEPAAGGIAARRAVQAVAAEFERRGGKVRLGHVLPPKESGGRLKDIALTGGETLRAQHYVFACGPWLGKLFPEAVGARIAPTRQEVFYFGAPAGDRRFTPSLLPIWYRLSDEFYGFPDVEGRGVKIASDRHGPPHDLDSAERLPGAEALAEARAALARILPALADAPLVESRVCQYENTSNGDFLIDRHPALENVWLAGGGSGHGFKHGPAVARYVTRLVLDEGQPDQRFSLAAKSTEINRQIR